MYQSDETKKLRIMSKINYSFLPFIILSFLAFAFFGLAWLCIGEEWFGKDIITIILVFGAIFIVASAIWIPTRVSLNKQMKAASEIDKKFTLKQKEAEFEVELELKKEKMKKEFWEKENSEKQRRCTYCNAMLEQTDKVCSQCGRTV